MKQIVRLTESDLHKIVKESVKKILNEHYKDYPRNDEYLEMAMDEAKRFLRDYGGEYKDYPGPSISFTNHSVEDMYRHADYIYSTLKYQGCMDKKLMGAMEQFLEYYRKL